MRMVGSGFLAGIFVVIAVRLLAAPLETPTYSELAFRGGFDLLPAALVVVAALVAVVAYRVGGYGAPVVAGVVVAAVLVLPEFWGITICPPLVPGCDRAVTVSSHYPPLALAGLLLPLVLTRRLLGTRSADA